MHALLKTLVLLLVGCLVASAAWFAEAPSSTEVNAVPEKYQETVDKGLEYLLKQQCQDGHWEGDGGRHPMAMTGLVGLALVMEGRREYRGRSGTTTWERKLKHLANVNRAVDWLIEKSQARREGLIFSEHPSETARYMEGHGLAMIFLAGAFEAESDKTRQKKLSEVLTRGVKYIVKAQSSLGGWYHTSRTEGHDFDAMLPTVIQIQALEAAEYAGGVPVPEEVIKNGLAYLKNGLAKHEQKMGLNAGRPFETAATLACLRVGQVKFGLSGRIDDPSRKLYDYCRVEIPVDQNLKFGRDELTHYYYSQAMFNDRGDPWKEYTKTVFDRLQSSQNKDGSWPAANGIGVGQIYSTALWCTVLQVGVGHPAVLISEGND